VPLLIYGPEISAAVRWAQENTGVAEIFVEEGQTALFDSVKRLNSMHHRQKLGAAALRAGRNISSMRRRRNNSFKPLRDQ